MLAIPQFHIADGRLSHFRGPRPFALHRGEGERKALTDGWRLARIFRGPPRDELVFASPEARGGLSRDVDGSRACCCACREFDWRPHRTVACYVAETVRRLRTLQPPFAGNIYLADPSRLTLSRWRMRCSLKSRCGGQR